MDKQELLNKIYDSLCNFVIRATDEKNASPNIELVPAVVDRILELYPLINN